MKKFSLDFQGYIFLLKVYYVFLFYMYIIHTHAHTHMYAIYGILNIYVNCKE